MVWIDSRSSIKQTSVLISFILHSLKLLQHASISLQVYILISFNLIETQYILIVKRVGQQTKPCSCIYIHTLSQLQSLLSVSLYKKKKLFALLPMKFEITSHGSYRARVDWQKVICSCLSRIIYQLKFCLRIMGQYINK